MQGPIPFSILALTIYFASSCPAALAFGPPAAVVVDVDVVPVNAEHGRFEISLRVENVTPESSTWRPSIAVSQGWSVTTLDDNISLGAASVAESSGEIRVGLNATEPTCPPDGAVLEITLQDTTGRNGEVRERLHFHLGHRSPVLVPFETYAKNAEWFDAGTSSRDGCSKSLSATHPTSAGRAPSQEMLLTTGRTFVGQIVFWDSRNKRSNATGSRLLTCNTANTTCSPNSSGCCRRGVPRVTVNVHGQSGLVASALTDNDGFFTALASNQPDTEIYQLKVRLDRPWAQSPGPLEVQNSGGSVVEIAFLPQQTSSATLDFDIKELNSPGDTTSSIGDQATLFVAGTEAFQALVDEGETRHLAPSPTGMRHRFRHGSGSNSTDCDDHIVYIQSAYSRAVEAVHLLGFLYLGDVVGCSTNSPSYPTYYVGGYDRYTAEGNALRVGIPSLLLTLSRWDPDTSVTSSIFSALFPCRSDGFANANRASDERNNWHALWEFIDSDTSNTSGVGADFIDVTVVEVLDGILDLKNESGTGNHENGEQSLIEVPSSVCFSSDDCNDNEACVGYICWSGDPHGENIYDVVYRMAELAGGGFQHFAFYPTLTSSPCMGAADDQYQYTGAFRGD